jgi:hypothetical protein
MKQPDPAPDLHWADITAALKATGCQPDETMALLDRGELIIVVPSIGAAMMFAAQLTIGLIGGDVAAPGAKLVHTAGEVQDILARASDAWLRLGGGITAESAPMLVLAFPGVTVTGAPADAATKSCRQCGCTELHACPGGCGWAEPDLCTACAGDRRDVGAKRPWMPAGELA